jgi:peroxiredoxin family protein
VSQRFIVLDGGTGEKLILANRARAGGIEANLFFTSFGLDAVRKGVPAGEFYDLAAGREIVFT